MVVGLWVEEAPARRSLSCILGLHILDATLPILIAT